MVLFVALAGVYLAFGVGALPALLRSVLGGRVVSALAGPAVILVVIVSYAAVTRTITVRAVAEFAVYLVASALLVAWRPAPRGTFPARELGAAIILGAPIKWHLLPRLLLGGAGAYDATRLVALVAGMYVFLVVRNLEGVGYRWSLRGRDVRIASAAFLAFALIAVPLGLGMHFLVWHPRLTVSSAVVNPVVIYLVTAVPEEFLFRGLIQNLCVRWLGKWRGLAIASVLFGLSHLPDPRYALLATIAGAAYGWVYLLSGRITASAITHALVDGTWVALLRV